MGQNEPIAAPEGTFVVERADGTLRGPAGAVRLDPKVIEVLELLLERPGELVPREALIARVWPDTVVTDHALSRCIYALRQGFEAAAGDPTGRAAVETLPKRGYRLTVPLIASPSGVSAPGAGTPESPRVRPTTRSRRTSLAALLAVVAIVALWLGLREGEDRAGGAVPQTIAVLPFVDMTADQDQQYFGDGIAEEILNVIAQSPDLRVIARTSSFQFRDGAAGIPSIGERLGADYVLEGSVRREEDRVRITAQLIDAADGIHVWSRIYDRNVGAVLEVQSDIAAEVAAVLAVSLGHDPSLTKPGPIDPVANEQALLGRFYLNRRNEGDLERATAHFRQAVEREPGHAGAWSGLASALYLRAAEGRMPYQDGLAAAAAASERAVELAPTRAEGLIRAARVAYLRGDLAASMDFRARASAAEPRHPLVMWFRANLLVRESRFPEAVAVVTEIARLDPLNGTTRYNLGGLQAAAGDFDAALATLVELRAINPTDSDIDAQIAELQLLTGDRDAALATALAAPSGLSRDRVLALVGRGTGPDGQAAARLRLERDGSALAASIYAGIAAYRGDSNEAFARLETVSARLQGASEPVANAVLDDVALSPFLINLRDDDRWLDWWSRVPVCHNFPISATESAEEAWLRKFDCLQRTRHDGATDGG